MESAVAIGYEVVGFFGSCGLFGKEGSHSTGEQTKKNRFSTDNVPLHGEQTQKHSCFLFSFL